ncbi:MAG TPA: anti-sigma factor, partial [Acidiphilium sp.]
DPTLAAEVAAWEERLLPLALAIPETEPPASLWRDIERRISPAVAQDAPRRTVSVWRERFWNNVAVWRGIGAVAVAAVIALAILRPHPAPPPHMVAVLAGKSGPMFTVAMRGNGAMSISPVADIAPPAGKVWQLWAVASGGKPVAVGFVEPGHTVLPANDMPSDMRRPKILLAVTVEPPGGSPTGQPDSPIVFSGPLLPMGR